MNLPPQGNSSQAAYWEQRYHSGDTPWNKGRAHPAIEEWVRQVPELAGTKVLVPGCGWGYDVAAWHSAGADAWGLDISYTAVQGAKRLHPGGQFCQGSIFAPPADWSETFDWVCEHTCFCAIDPVDRPLYLVGVHQVLRKGGRLMAVFYCDPDHEEEGPPFGITSQEIARFFGISGGESHLIGEREEKLHSGMQFSLEARWEPRSTFLGREEREEVWILRKDG